MGQAHSPCGVESAMYAQPHTRVSRREPGTLCGCFSLVISIRSNGFCVAFGVQISVQCIVYFAEAWSDYGMVLGCCRGGVRCFLCVCWREFRN